MAQAFIRITRGGEYFGVFRTLGIYIDEQKVAKIPWNTSIDFAMPPGPHTVSVWMDWCGSPQCHIDLKEDELAELVVTLPNPLLRGLKIFRNTGSYFGLERKCC